MAISGLRPWPQRRRPPDPPPSPAARPGRLRTAAPARPARTPASQGCCS